MNQATIRCKSDSYNMDHWAYLAKKFGRTVEELKAMDSDELHALAEEEAGEISFGLSTGGLIPRGNVLLGHGRILDSKKLAEKFNRRFK